MPPIIRRGDMITCGDRMGSGSPNVFANNIPVSRKLIDITVGHCFTPTRIYVGSPTVFVNNIAAVHVGHPIIPHKCKKKTHGGMAAIGSPNVFVGGGGGNIPLTPEQEQYALGAAAAADVDTFRQPTASRRSFAYTIVDDHIAPDIGPADPGNVAYKNQVEAEEGPAERQIPLETIDAGSNLPHIPTNCADIDSHVGPFPTSFPLSTNFTLGDLTTGARISKYPLVANVGLTEKQIVCNLRQLCVNVLEILRSAYPTTLRINSGFRSGTGRSQHLRGQAADIAFLDIENNHDAMIQRAIDVLNFVRYDQFIFERQRTHWLHISFSSTPTVAPENRVLTLVSGSNPPRYVKGVARTASNA